MDLDVDGICIEWRGPAPHHFLPLPPDAADLVGDVAPRLSYGWGCVPVTATIGRSQFRTSLMPKDGGYLLPLKVAVRRREGIEIGTHVVATVHLG